MKPIGIICALVLVAWSNLSWPAHNQAEVRNLAKVDATLKETIQYHIDQEKRYKIRLIDNNEFTGFLAYTPDGYVTIDGNAYLKPGYKISLSKIQDIVVSEDSLKVEAKNAHSLHDKAVIYETAPMSAKESKWRLDKNLTLSYAFQKTVKQLASEIPNGNGLFLGHSFNPSLPSYLIPTIYRFYLELGFWRFAHNTTRVQGISLQIGPSFKLFSIYSLNLSGSISIISGLNYEMIANDLISGSQVTFNATALPALQYSIQYVDLSLGLRINYNYSPEKPLISLGPQLALSYSW